MRRPYAVQVFLKAGESFVFECAELQIELAEDGQHIQKFSWEDAYPAIMFLHLDNVATILYTYDHHRGQDESPDQSTERAVAN